MKQRPWRKILYNASLLSVIQAIGDFSGLILYVVLSRYFGPEGIGLYAFGYSIALIAYFVIVFGFDDYGIRECALIDQYERGKLLGKIVSIQLLLLSFVLISLTLFIIITSPPLTDIIVIYSMLFYLIALAFGKVLFVPSNSQQQMIAPALSELLIKIVSVSGAAALVIFYNSPLHIALLAYPASGVLIIILSYKSVKHFNGSLILNFNIKELLSLVKQVWPFSASLLVFPVYTRAGLIILTLLMGNAAAGVYAPSLKFVEVGLMPVIFFSFSVYPVLSRYFASDYRKFEDSAEKYFRAIFIIAALLFWALYFIVPVLVVPLFGNKFESSIILVKYFSILIFIYSLTKGLHKLLLAAKLQVYRVKFEFIVLIISLLMNVTLIPLFGAKGAVFAFIISEASLVVFFVYAIYRNSILLYRKLIKTIQEFFLPLCITLAGGISAAYFDIPEIYTMAITFLLFLSTMFFSGFIRKFDIQFLKSS